MRYKTRSQKHMGFHSRSSNSWTRVYPGSCTPHNKVEGVLDSAPKPSAFVPNKPVIIAILKIFCPLWKP